MRVQESIVPLVNIYKTDWFKVLCDISRAGFSLQTIAYELDVATSTLIGWKQGASPRHHTGEALIDIWMNVTGRDRKELPRVVCKRAFIHKPLCIVSPHSEK